LRKKSATALIVGMTLALTALAACSNGDDVTDSGETGAAATGQVQSEDVSSPPDGPPGGPPEGPPSFLSDLDLSAADIAYLVAVRDANESRDEIFEGFVEIFERTWPLRSQLISALIEGGVGTPFVETLATLRALEPTDRFIDGHAILIQMVQQQVDVDAGARDAIIADDVAGFALANGELGRIAPTFGPLLPRHLCEATAGNAESTARICGPPDDIPGGEYGAGLDALLRENSAQIAAAGGTIAFPLSLSDDEMAEVFSQVLPAVTDSLAQRTSDLAALTPPSEYASDHAVMETFFSDMSAFFDSLSQYAKAGDIASIRFGFLDFETVVCDALGGLGSGDVRLIAEVHLGPQAACDGGPIIE
jgi:hypothetical protein